MSITEIGESDDVRPVSHLSAKISGGVYPHKGAKPLKMGKYTFVIESLGDNNLKGFFEYTFSPEQPISAEQFVTLVLRLLGYTETEPTTALEQAIIHNL